MIPFHQSIRSSKQLMRRPICPFLNRFTSLFFIAIFLAMMPLSPQVIKAVEVSAALVGEKTLWHGFDRYDFVMDEETLVISPTKAEKNEGNGVNAPMKGQRRCILVVPKQAADGNPWSWQGCYWDHQPQAEIELLRRGFHVAYISANQDLKPGKQWDAWYEFLTTHGLSPKPNFIGMSRGGEYSYI